MTSPAPISIYHPVCSYCWKESKKAIFFMTIKGKFHWACCKEHLKELLEDEEIDYKKSLNFLTNMYLELYKEKKFPFIKKILLKLKGVSSIQFPNCLVS